MAIPHKFSEASSTDLRHDIFISFRGEDTRLNFISYLDKALSRSNIDAFLDRKIEVGDSLPPALESEIKASRAYIIVFSKTYAFSRWCLDELVLILKQHKESNRRIIPIFYHVDPGDVKKLRGSFKDAMAKHQQTMKDEKNPQKRSKMESVMQQWKDALEEVANLKGHDVKDKVEAEFIEDIIRDIRCKLVVLLRSKPPYLFGMKEHVESITSWLNDGSTYTTDILTIVGMGGIGKTSLAKSIYWSHFHLFQGSSFIENINRKCLKSCDKLLDLQKTLCESILGTSLDHVNECTSIIEHALNDKKLLVVLDDVDSVDQLNALLGNRGFCSGSKIIITTKDASLTKKFKPGFSTDQPKHTTCLLQGLNETSSLKLLSLHAFGSYDLMKGYEVVSKKLVTYCNGHPLALKEMGTYLCDRGLPAWQEYEDGLKKDKISSIQKKLHESFESSFESLLGADKELFKHIACFFVGKDRAFAETILKACDDINPINGIKNLVDRFLLMIGPRNELMMHQLFQYVGKNVVRNESHKPWKRSRLWCHEESLQVLQRKRGNQVLLGIILDGSMLEEEEQSHGSPELETEALNSMDNLAFLQLNHVKFKGSYKNFPKKLRWLCMHGFPSQSIPSDLLMRSLVVLDMSYSNIKSFDMSSSAFELFDVSHSNIQRPLKRRKLTGSSSKGIELLGSLKILNLSFCDLLYSLNGLSNLPALERLILAGCISLTEICESIGSCDKLVVIDLSYCNSLKELPKTLRNLEKLEALSLDGCNLGKLPIDINNPDADRNCMDSQASSSVTVETLPRDLKSFAIRLANSLVSLSLEDDKWHTESFPMEFSSLSMSETLNLDGNSIVSLPNCVRSLRRIELLSSGECNMLKTIEHPACTLRNLKFSRWDVLKGVKFHTKMSPLAIALTIYSHAHDSIEIKGIVEFHPIAEADDLVRRLGWNGLDFIKNQEVETWHDLKRKKKSQVPLFYEFGIFSTFYGGNKIPDWIINTSPCSSISFSIPSCSKKLRGLNFCHLQTGRDVDDGVNLLTVIITNKTKNCTWIYKHYIHWVKVNEECLIWLSHWMFGKNEMESGDQVTITIPEEDQSANVSIRECGVSFVYDDGKMEEEDVLAYYKSWNHIIGGDLSAFCLTTGEYFLDNHRFFWWHIDCPVYRPFIENGASYKEEGVYFRAFPQKKSDNGGTPEDVKEYDKELATSQVLDVPNGPRPWRVYSRKKYRGGHMCLPGGQK